MNGTKIKCFQCGEVTPVKETKGWYINWNSTCKEGHFGTCPDCLRVQEMNETPPEVYPLVYNVEQ